MLSRLELLLFETTVATTFFLLLPVEAADAAVDCDKLFLLDPAEEEDRLLELEDLSLEDDVGLSFEDEEDRCFEEDVLI